MADLETVQGKVKIVADTKGVDDAKESLGGFGGSLNMISQIAAGVGLERLAEQFINVSKAAGEFAVDTSTKFEQWDVAFTSMLGSSEQAAKLLNQLSDFAQKTPFTLPSVVEASKQLIAYGFSAQEVVPQMKMLGDVAAALNVPMNDMVYVYGTLRTQGTAYTRDLLQFSQRGIPIWDELAKTMGVSKEQVKGLVEQGKVGFPQVEKAFEDMTNKGGKFFDHMKVQSQTFGGILSNVQDQFTRFALAVMGFDMNEGSKTFGQIQKGTLFDQMKDGAQSLLNFLNANQGKIVAGFTVVAKAIQGIWTISVMLWNHIVTAFTPAFEHLTDVYMRHKEQIDTIAKALGYLLYGAIVLIIDIVAFAINIFADWTDTFLNRFGPALQWISSVIVSVGNAWNSIVASMENTFINFVNSVIRAVNVLIDAMNKIPGVNIGKLGSISLVSSGGAALTPVTGGSKTLNITNFNSFNGGGSGLQLSNNLNFQLAGLKF